MAEIEFELSGTNTADPNTPVSVSLVAVVNPDGTNVGGGGGGGGGLTDAQLRATPVPVSVAGSATAALQTTLNGQVGALTVVAATAPDVASASTNALLRGIFTELRAQTALLQTIATNTAA